MKNKNLNRIDEMHSGINEYFTLQSFIIFIPMTLDFVHFLWREIATFFIESRKVSGRRSYGYACVFLFDIDNFPLPIEPDKPKRRGYILGIPVHRSFNYGLKPVLLSVCLLYFCGNGYGQDTMFIFQPDDNPKIHRFQIGLKVGTPGIVSLGAEFVIPALENRLAPFIDYSNIKIYPVEEAEFGHKYFEYGINLYFSGKGKGGYLSVSRSDLGLNAISQEEGYSAYGELSFESTNVKLGGRFGKRVYFRIEAGYSFGKVPEGIGFEEHWNDGSVESGYEDFPEEFTELTKMGLPLFNIGFGIRI